LLPFHSATSRGKAASTKMGAQANTTMRLGRKTKVAGTVLLETDYLLFRGAERLKIPLSDVRAAEAKDGVLHVTFSKGVASFDLGRRAARWAEKITKPKGRLEKLGLKPGASASLVGDFEVEFVAEIAPFVKGKETAFDHVFFSAEAKRDLARVSRLSRTL